MKPETTSFLNQDGQRIHTIHWLPVGEIKAVIILVHGIAEHSARYQHVAEYLSQHGYAVYALDHRGHGLSEGLRTYFDTFEQPVADLEHYVEQVKTAQPGKKLFMYGHSMGSLISLLYILKHQVELAGWISSGSPVNLDEAVSPIVVSAGLFVARIAPKLRLFPVKSKGISHDPQIVAAYDSDPHIDRRPVRTGMAAGIVKNGRQARQQVFTLRLPVLILHGADDPLAPPSGSQYLYNHIGSIDKTLKVYTGMYHEIHNEIERQRVLDDVLTWLNAHN